MDETYWTQGQTEEPIIAEQDWAPQYWLVQQAYHEAVDTEKYRMCERIHDQCNVSTMSYK